MAGENIFNPFNKLDPVRQLRALYPQISGHIEVASQRETAAVLPAVDSPEVQAEIERLRTMSTAALLEEAKGWLAAPSVNNNAAFAAALYEVIGETIR